MPRGARSPAGPEGAADVRALPRRPAAARVCHALGWAGLLVATGLPVVTGAIVQTFAVTVQRFRPYPPELAELTGAPGADLGSPVEVLVFDRSQLVRGPDGRLRLSIEAAYPIQTQTVWFLASRAAGTAALATAVLWMLAILLGGAQQPHPTGTRNSRVS